MFPDLFRSDCFAGISSIRPRIWGYYYDESNGANYTGIGSSSPAADLLLESLLVSGRYPQKSEQGAVVLGSVVIDNLNLGERKNFSLFRPDLTQVPMHRMGVFQ